MPTSGEPPQLQGRPTQAGRRQGLRRTSQWGPPQLQGRPTQAGRRQGLRRANQGEATTAPGETNSGREEAGSQACQPVGSHHSSRGDQLRQGVGKVSGVPASGDHHSSRGDQLRQGGGRVSGVPIRGKPPQLQGRPTQAGRRQGLRRANQWGATTAPGETNSGREGACSQAYQPVGTTTAPGETNSSREEAGSQACQSGGSHHSSRGDQLRQGGGTVSGVPTRGEPPQLKGRPTQAGRGHGLRRANQWGATTAPGETNSGREEAGSQAYQPGGSHHSSRGDQLRQGGGTVSGVPTSEEPPHLQGRPTQAGRRQGLRRANQGGATTVPGETNSGREEAGSQACQPVGSHHSSRGDQLRQGGGRVSGVPTSGEPPQLQGRPTQAGSRQGLRRTTQWGPPQLQGRPTQAGRRQGLRRANQGEATTAPGETNSGREEAGSQACQPVGSHHSSRGDQLRQGGGTVSGVPAGGEPPQLHGRPTQAGRRHGLRRANQWGATTAPEETNSGSREEEAGSQVSLPGWSHHSSRGDQLRQGGGTVSGVPARGEPPQLQGRPTQAGRGHGLRRANQGEPPQLQGRPTQAGRGHGLRCASQGGATTAPGETNSGREEARSQACQPVGSHHSSRGDQLRQQGRGGEVSGEPTRGEPPQLHGRPTQAGRRQGLRRANQGGATTAQGETNSGREEAGSQACQPVHSSRGDQLRQGGGTVSGVPTSGEPPQLQGRPTQAGRGHGLRRASQGGATTAPGETNSGREEARSQACQPVGSHHSSRGDQLRQQGGGGEVSGEPTRGEPPQLHGRPTQAGRRQGLRRANQGGATTAPLETNSGREEAGSQACQPVHSSRGDQLRQGGGTVSGVPTSGEPPQLQGRPTQAAGRRRRGLRRAYQGGATTAPGETNSGREEAGSQACQSGGSHHSSMGDQLRQGGGRVSGVPTRGEPPQLQGRPTQAGRGHGLRRANQGEPPQLQGRPTQAGRRQGLRRANQGEATTAPGETNSGREGARSQVCQPGGSHHSSRGDQLRQGGGTVSGVPTSGEPPQLQGRPTQAGRRQGLRRANQGGATTAPWETNSGREEAGSQGCQPGGSHHSSRGDQLRQGGGTVSGVPTRGVHHSSRGDQLRQGGGTVSGVPTRGSHHSSRGDQLRQGGGRVSGVPIRGKPPQLQGRPTQAGRGHGLRCASQGVATTALGETNSGREGARSQACQPGGSHHSSRGDQLRQGGGTVSGVPTRGSHHSSRGDQLRQGGGRVSGVPIRGKPPQLQGRPTQAGRGHGLRRANQGGATTAQGETNSGREGARSQACQPGGATTAPGETNSGREEAGSQACQSGGSHHSSRGDQLRQGGGRVSGVPIRGKPPQLQGRPTQAGRGHGLRCASQGGATTAPGETKSGST